MSNFGFQSSGGSSSPTGVQSVTGLNTDNTDPQNPIVEISVDGTTITGLGTPASPLIASAQSLGGENYIFVNSDGTTDENGLAFYNAYQLAKTLTPNGSAISATNQVTIVLAPGIYTYGTLPIYSIILDTQYINITSLTSQPDVVLDSTGAGLDALSVQANNIKVTGVKTLNYITVLTDSGSTFTNCIAGDYSFGALGATVLGTYVNCVAGDYSFGGGPSNASGNFINCVAGQYSFGSEASAAGYFRDCVGAFASFGGGGGALASGTFINCSGGINCFGFNFTGIAYNCISNDESFGYLQNSGTCYSCVASGSSFIMQDGFLYYCRLTTGTFAAITGTGKIVLGIDGNNNIQTLG